MVNLDVFWAFDKQNPIRTQYDASIAASQDGAFDNDNKRMRFYGLHQLIERAGRLHPAADIAECGCWMGHSTHMTSSILSSLGFQGRLAVFDSFEGLSEFQQPDISVYSESQEQRTFLRQHFRSNLTNVSSLLAKFPFVELHPGWIPEHFSQVEDWTFSHVSVDVDLYEPTRDAIRFFFPRLLSGSTIYLDDYGYKDFPGAKQAVDELLSELQPSLFFEFPYGSAVLVK